MGGLGNISGKQAVKAFERAGWTQARQAGSHVSMTKPGSIAILTAPMHKELRTGTLMALLRAAGLTMKEFKELLK